MMNIEGALERWVRCLSEWNLIAAPGEKFKYNNTGFEVLGDVIAKISGLTFEAYIQENILSPLGMKASTLLVREAGPGSLARPHILDEAGRVVDSRVFPYNRRHAPSSTLYSNVEEMNRWALANLRRGELDGRRILESASYDLLWKAHAEVPTSPMDTLAGSG